MQYPIQLPVYHSHFTNTLEFKVSFSVFSHNKIRAEVSFFIKSVRSKHMQYPIQLPVYHSHFTNTLEFKVSFSVFSHNKNLIYSA